MVRIADASPLSNLNRMAVPVAIVVLLVNDHVLKYAYPSWLTGKLSDFAGVFMLPLLILGTWTLVSKGRAHPTVDTMVTRSAFILVGMWFTLMQVSPSVASATERLAETVTGSPARLTLDPTDLVALVMLWPAWIVWRRSNSDRTLGVINGLGRLQGPPHSGRSILHRAAALLVLSVGWMATVATSYAPEPDPQVVRLAVEGDFIYARISDPNDRDAIFISEDGARTWTEFAEYISDRGWSHPECEACDQEFEKVELPDSIKKGSILPRVECTSDQGGPCFRIDGRPLVERSDDGGTTWRVSVIWAVPSERESYALKRFDSTELFGPPTSMRRSYRTESHDLLILSVDDGLKVLVAMGSEGIVRIDAESSEFERIGIGGAIPTPWAAESLLDALMAMRSEWLSAVIAALALAAISLWRALPSADEAQDDEPSDRPPGLIAWLAAAVTIWLPFAIGFGMVPPAFGPTTLVVLAFIFVFMSLGSFAFPAAGLATIALAVLLIRIAIMPLVRYSRRLSATGGDIASAWRTARMRSLITFGIVGLVGSGAFVFWAMGWIPQYEISVVIALACTVWGILRVARSWRGLPLNG